MARKDRKPKQFLDSKDEALRLAHSVAATQEGISKKKVERHTQHEGTKATPPPQKKSKSKDKLKQVKAALATEAANAKREKAKARKQAKSTDNASGQPRGEELRAEPSIRPRKRVKFAD
ncbi:hypothetical protein EVJ58_g5392 [Rhodofomes roseus]|uniref:Uncharacterized protein n=1 Tax=Rhodofomes roseus TaxID=34475 RepID=A0A4Y9YE98_9APHY|nr:hypothetical protein EVJ58_g5392 [Rhodofomes roseus]